MTKFMSTTAIAIAAFAALPAAAETANYWFARAKSAYAKAKQSKAYDERIANAPDYNIEALNERKFMEWLGECARPAK